MDRRVNRLSTTTGVMSALWNKTPVPETIAIIKGADIIRPFFKKAKIGGGTPHHCHPGIVFQKVYFLL